MLVDKKRNKLTELTIILVSLLLLAVVGLIQVEKPALLLEVIDVKAVDSIEVIRDEQDYAEPLQATRCLNTKDDHETCKFHQKQRLQDGVVAE